MTGEVVFMLVVFALFGVGLVAAAMTEKRRAGRIERDLADRSSRRRRRR